MKKNKTDKNLENEDLIRNVTIDGNIVSFDCDQKIRDKLLTDGLQIMADEHFGGRKVVVVPCCSGIGELVTKEKTCKTETLEIGDEFANECISVAFNHFFRIFLDELRDEYDLKNLEKADQETVDKSESTEYISGRKPCPYCGGTITGIAYGYDSRFDSDEISVRCRICSGRGPVCDTEEDAWKEWNSRTI